MQADFNIFRGNFKTSKNGFLKNSSKFLLVSSLAGSFIPQNTKAAGGFELTAEQNNGSSFFEVWTITPKLILASWYLSFREFLFSFFSKNKAEVEEKSTLGSAVKLDGKNAEEKVPEELQQLQSALEKKFGLTVYPKQIRNGKITEPVL